MTSRKQLEANRKNALRSTGPKTEGGKKASSRNALQHGLTSTAHVVIAGEDPSEFQGLLDSCVRDLIPSTPLQMNLVERLAQTLWRMRRVGVFESALLSWLQRVELIKDQNAATVSRIGRSTMRLPAANVQGARPGLPAAENGPFDHLNALGRTLECALSKQDMLNKLNRYEAGLLRVFEQTLNHLTRIRALNGKVRS